MSLGRLETEADLRNFLDDYTREVQTRVQTLWSSSGGGVTDQHIKDVAGAEIVGGTGISVAYDGTHVTITNTSPGGGGVGVHALLSSAHSDTVPASPARGALIVGNATPAWAALSAPSVATAGTGYFLRTQGGASDPSWGFFDSSVRALVSASWPLRYDNTSGAFSIVPWARGGLLTTMTGFNVPAILAIGARNTYLRSDGADPTWAPVTTADISDFPRGVDDQVATLLKPGPGIALTYNQTLGQLLVTASAASYSDYQAQDAVGNVLNDSSTVDFTYTKSARWNAFNWNDGTTWNQIAGITAIIKAGSIDNSHISSTAAIDYSKLSLPTRGDLWTRDGSGSARIAISGTAGKYLRSDGTDPSWQTIAAADVTGLAHNLLSATHSDTLADTVVRGDVIVGNSTPKWARLAKGSSGTFLRSDGTDASWSAILAADLSARSIADLGTKTHSLLTSLSADDHTQYPLLAGRSGGQTLIGGTAAADSLGLRPTAASGGASIPANRVEVDLTGAVAQTFGILMSTTPGSQTAIQVADGQTLVPTTSMAIRALAFGPTITVNVALGTGNIQLFNASPAMTWTASGARFGTQMYLWVKPQYNVSSGVTINQIGASGATARAVAFEPNFVAIPGGGSAGATTRPDAAAVFVQGTVDTGWRVATNRYGVTYMAVPAGAGTIDQLVAHDVDDLAAFAGTLTNTPLSLRSLGATVQMRHAGPVRVGATGAPNTASGLDVQGDLSLQHADLTLANGANNDIAVGNKSVIRIAGPTGAFNITSLGTPYAGKIVTLVNTTAQAMTITNAAGTGTAANRIVTSTNADLVGTGGNQTTVTLVYDATTARWRDTAWRP